MSNSITDFLAAIMAAKYGEQVRSAIHDAIELCYQDGKAGVNDLEARHLIEQVIGVNEMQDAGIETLTARVEALEQGGEGESAGTTTTTVPTFIVDSGIANFSNVQANKTATETVTFSKTFTEAPVVVCIKAFRNAANTFYSQVTAQPILSSITTTGCTLAVGNRYTQAVSPSVLWIAFQPTEIEINTEIIVPSGDGMAEAEVIELLAPISAALNGIKTGYDGTVYDTPGEAVREQINDLHVLIGDEPGTAIQASAVAYGDSDVGTELTNVNGRLQQEVVGMAKVTLTSSNVSGDYADMNTFPRNQIVICAVSAINLISHYPKGYNTGGTVITLNGYSGANGAVQIVNFFNNFYARRICVSGTWSEWEYPEVFYRTYKVRTDGTGDFGSVVSAIKNTMTSGLASPFYRYIIDIGEGTFDLSGVSDLVLNNTIDQRGLFVMPYVTIRGNGKDKTILTYHYSGSNDAIMSMVSGLNMAYESSLEDLTLSVKNIRYAVHSDNALSSEQSDLNNPLLNNNKITLKNVRLEHLGFSSGLTPTYKVPAAWGGGSWDATDREFINCDFISKEVCGFLNHDRVGITKPSHFTFKNCNFITYNSDVRAQAVTGYSSCALISWGSGIKTLVSFENCMANKFVALTVVTNYNSDAVIDYDVKADNELFIIESTTNDAHLNDNFRTSGCLESVCAGAAITAYDPVSKNRLYWVHGYNSADAVHGIALNSCAQNEICMVQTNGFVALPLLTSNTFADGVYIGYANGEWVEDAEHPIIRVIGGNVGLLV